MLIFVNFFQEENLTASQLPIDSPSQKMLNFMAKHYHLEKPLKQSNYFAVFPLFFRDVENVLVNRRNSRRAKSRQVETCISSAELQRYTAGSSIGRYKSPLVPWPVPFSGSPDLGNDSSRMPSHQHMRTSIPCCTGSTENVDEVDSSGLQNVVPQKSPTHTRCVSAKKVTDSSFLPKPEPHTLGRHGSASTRYLSREGYVQVLVCITSCTAIQILSVVALNAILCNPYGLAINNKISFRRKHACKSEN